MTVLFSYKLKVAQIRLRRRHMYPLGKLSKKDNNNSWSYDAIVCSDLKGANVVDRVGGSLTSLSTLKNGLFKSNKRYFVSKLYSAKKKSFCISFFIIVLIFFLSRSSFWKFGGLHQQNGSWLERFQTSAHFRQLSMRLLQNVLP